MSCEAARALWLLGLGANFNRPGFGLKSETVCDLFVVAQHAAPVLFRSQTAF
jgi:hypothetical protein